MCLSISQLTEQIESIQQDEKVDILSELLAYKSEAQSLNMDLPIKKTEYKLLECPHCQEICAYKMPSLSSNWICVCDYCNGEF